MHPDFWLHSVCLGIIARFKFTLPFSHKLCKFICITPLMGWEPYHVRLHSAILNSGRKEKLSKRFKSNSCRNKVLSKNENGKVGKTFWQEISVFDSFRLSFLLDRHSGQIFTLVLELFSRNQTLFNKIAGSFPTLILSKRPLVRGKWSRICRIFPIFLPTLDGFWHVYQTFLTT